MRALAGLAILLSSAPLLVLPSLALAKDGPAECAKSACKTRAGEQAVINPQATTCTRTTACLEAAGCTKAQACKKNPACTKSEACTAAKGCDAAVAKACDASTSCKVTAQLLNVALAIKNRRQAKDTETAACNAGRCEAEGACAKSTRCEKTGACETLTAAKEPCACSKTACAKDTACASDCNEVMATDAARECAGERCCTGGACEAVAESSTASCSGCEKLALATDERCASELPNCDTASCSSSKCESGEFASREQLMHLTKAAAHLTAAGHADEAKCVLSMAAKFREELVAHKLAQIASLQAEVASLAGGEPGLQTAVAPCAAPRAWPQPGKQIAVNVKMVELSLSKMKHLGFKMVGMKADALETAECKDSCYKAAQPSAVLGFMSALEREHLAKVLAWPTVVMADGGSFQAKHREFGTHLDVQAKLVDDQHVRVEIRATKPGEEADSTACDEASGPKSSIAADFEIELGKTAVLEGLVQERMIPETDPETSEPKLVRQEVQTLFLVTPELSELPSVVTPASHVVPREASSAPRRQIKSIRIFDHVPGQSLPRFRYSFPTESR